MAKKHVQKKNREYYGEPHGSHLASYLNREWPGPPTKDRPPGRAEVKRVAHLVALAQAVAANNYSTCEELSTLTRILKKYRFMLWPVLTKTGMEAIYWLPQPHAVEGVEIWRLFELVRHGLHRRLRQCDWCKRWIYIHSTAQRFCKGTDCKRKYRESSEEYKAYHRRKEKDRYWIRKLGNGKKRTK